MYSYGGGAYTNKYMGWLGAGPGPMVIMGRGLHQ